MASTTGKTNPQYRPASRRPMPRNAPSGKPARPSREPVPQERYRTGTAKPKRRRMRSMKAHIWDTGVFFSVLLLLITGLIALFSASYTNAMFYKGSATYFIMRQGHFRRDRSCGYDRTFQVSVPHVRGHSQHHHVDIGRAADSGCDTGHWHIDQ